MSQRYELIKKYYDFGIYTKDNLKVFVNAGWITEEESQTITGEGREMA